MIIVVPVLSVKFNADFPANDYLLGLRDLSRRMQLVLVPKRMVPS